MTTSSTKYASPGDAGISKLDATLNLCSNLYSPPQSDSNDLALRIGTVFDQMASEKPDMMIVVHHAEDGEEAETEDVEIPCHRVILGARCPYFRRALLSGMKEAIEK